jgi:predicted ATPase
MQIHSFRVQGFANFTQSVSLTPLSDVNVLYGRNDCGKSNLLRAVQLYFLLLGAGEAVSRQAPLMLDRLDPEKHALLRSAFNWSDPQPVVFDVGWRIATEEYAEFGLIPECAAERVETELELRPNNRNFELRVRRWMMGDTEVAGLERGGKSAASIAFAQQVRRLLADATPFREEQPVMPCRFVGGSAEPFSPELRDALFDARQSVQADARRRWTLFTEIASSLARELGPGSWQTVFDRATQKADLVYLRGEDAVPLERMSAGVRRLAGLVAELVLTVEPVLCMEEPEWKLSPEFQERLVLSMRRIVSARVGPRQFFITSHSPTLANLARPFAVLDGDEGFPTVRQEDWDLGPGSATGPNEDRKLSDLIGLLDDLSELDPEGFVAEPPDSSGASTPLGAASFSGYAYAGS